MKKKNSEKIFALKGCRDQSDWPFFIHALTDCVKKNKSFMISTLMNSFQDERRDIINITRFWDGFQHTELKDLDNQIWSRVFHPLNGPCFMFDLSNINEFKHILYQGYARPEFDFLLSKNIPWKKIRIFLHTKYDLPDAYQLNFRIDVKISNKTRFAHGILIRKTTSDRESSRKIPCTKYEYNTCQNIEDNNLILNKYNCQIPIMHYGQHLEDTIPQETPTCSDEVAKKAIYLISSKTTNCSKSPTCEMTRFTFAIHKASSYVENTNVVWIGFSNPEVANYHTYISYDLPSLIGEIGGILGITLGVSALTFFESLSNRIPYY